MTKEQFIKKITSRKFIISLATTICGVILSFTTNSTIQTIVGAIMAIIPTIVYCISEGKIDVASIGTITDTVTDTLTKLDVDDNVTKVVDTIGNTIEDTLEDEEISD